MKKLLSISSSKILMMCGLGLLMTLGSFWHYQSNQFQLDRMNVLNQGVGTCFNRISQTFTALMIREVHSPYLNRGFLGLSDECLNETIKGINPFKQNIGQGYVVLSKLISDVHWFHESILKVHSPMVAGKGMDVSLNPISSKFSQMEENKVNLMDEIDVTNFRIREIQSNDEVLMGIGLLMFVVALCVLSLKEFNSIQLQKEIENKALSLLNTGMANVAAMVDQIVERGLNIQGLPVTAQIFKDYHGDLMERIATRSVYNEDNKVETKSEAEVPEFVESNLDQSPKTSFK